MIVEKEIGQLVWYMCTFSAWANSAANAPEPMVQMREEEHKLFEQRIEWVVHKLSLLEMQLSLVSAKELKKIIFTETVAATAVGSSSHGRFNTIAYSKIAIGRFSNFYAELATRLRDELNQKRALFVSARNVKILETGAEVFGASVEKHLGGAREDLEQAAKALAYGLNTAVVFHLMRAMEIAVTEIGRSIGATVQDKNGQFLNWGIVASNIRAKIDEMPKVDLIAKQELGNLHSLFVSVNQAWRVPTMHPQKSYTDEQASDVFAAVKAFLKNAALFLSSRS